MEKKALLLAMAVYRVTKLFPEGEVLIGQLRSGANQVVSEVTHNNSLMAVLEIKTLLNLLIIAQKQQWTKSLNFVILKREYSSLIEEIKTGMTTLSADKRSKDYSLRQKRILKYVEEHKSAQLKEICALIPKISSRSLRGDLMILVKRKHIVQGGRGRSSFYTINKAKQ